MTLVPSPTPTPRHFHHVGSFGPGAPLLDEALVPVTTQLVRIATGAVIIWLSFQELLYELHAMRDRRRS